MRKLKRKCKIYIIIIFIFFFIIFFIIFIIFIIICIFLFFYLEVAIQFASGNIVGIDLLNICSNEPPPSLLIKTL